MVRFNVIIESQPDAFGTVYVAVVLLLVYVCPLIHVKLPQATCVAVAVEFEHVMNLGRMIGVKLNPANNVFNGENAPLLMLA